MFTFSIPTTTLFGTGKLNELHSQINTPMGAVHGKKALVVISSGKSTRANGYLDRLYVHKDYQGQGIASAICDELERFAAGKTFTTHASITAKLFFQHRGYHVVRKQEVIRHGVALTDFVMEKQPGRTK